MKKYLRILWRTVKVLAAAVLLFYFFGIVAFGITLMDKRSGFVRFKWSGLDELFEKDGKVSFYFNEFPEYSPNGSDGPYVFYDATGLRAIQVNEESSITDRKISRKDSLYCLVDNRDRDSFFFTLRDSLTIPESVYEMPDSLIAVSDIEGNFNGFYSLLTSNRIIDSSFRWTFGKGHLVLTGDFVDRGSQVTECLWLIYRLETEAGKAGGKVHYILGNHEVMNLRGNAGYVQEKYLGLAQKLSGEKARDKSIKFLYSPSTELGRWLRTKNCIEKIGSLLFVHGGLSPGILHYRLAPEQINKRVRSAIDLPDLDIREKSDTGFLMGRTGPLWYRGLVKDPRADPGDLDRILSFYSAEKVVVGHTIVDSVSAGYNGKVIRTDVKHSPEKSSGGSQALLIIKNKYYRVNDKGTRSPVL